MQFFKSIALTDSSSSARELERGAARLNASALCAIARRDFRVLLSFLSSVHASFHILFFSALEPKLAPLRRDIY